MALQFTDANFTKEVLESPMPVLVDFWAPWCGPCQMMGPVLDAFGQKYGTKVKVGKVNVDQNPMLSATFDIRSIPTLKIFVGGKEIKTMMGVHSEQMLVTALGEYLK